MTVKAYLESLTGSSSLLLLVTLLYIRPVQGAAQALHIMPSLVQLLAAALPISLPTLKQTEAAAYVLNDVMHTAIPCWGSLSKASGQTNFQATKAVL